MKRLIDASLVLAATCAAVAAQSPLFVLHGTDPNGQFGACVRGIGDVNADGRADFAVGAPFMDINGIVDTGMVRSYSGATGLKLREYRGDRDLEQLGCAVAGGGDLDGDKYGDFIFGVAVGRFRYPGEIWVTAGRNGRVDYRQYGELSYDHFGDAVAVIGDVDGDGYVDIAVGAPGRDDIGNNCGRVTIYSGMGRNLLHTIFGSAANEDLGAAVAAAGDFDQDGWGDVLIGAPRADQPGRTDCGKVCVYSGRTGALLHSWYGAAAGERLGTSVDGAGDANGDGFLDVIAGSALADVGGADAGRAVVFSGADGAVLWNWTGEAAGDKLGTAVAGVGDADGDGHGDVAVGAPLFDGAAGTDAGRVYVYSGATGALIAALDGESAGAQFGASIGGAGDVNFDGFGEVVVGAPFDVVAGSPVGSAYVFDLDAVGTPPKLYYRESGCPGSDDHQPRIEALGRAALGESYSLVVRGAKPNAPALLNLGVQFDLPLGTLAPGCSMHAFPLESYAAAVNADGYARVTPFVQIPIDPAFIGSELQHQWLIVDPTNNTLGVSFSNVAALVIGQ